MSFLKKARKYAVQRAVKSVSPITNTRTTASDKQKKLAAAIAPRDVELRGGVLAVQDCREKEVLIEGPFGTGKTTGILHWIYRLLDTQPGIRVLIVRKTRDDLTESVLKTWEEDVVPPDHPMLNGPTRQNRKKYTHLNGSTVVLGGLHNVKAIHKVKSAEYDIIYVAEATEITEEDYEVLIGRLRNYAMPWQQIILDCNPAHPQHWLNQRAIRGELFRIRSRHEDNPRYHNGTDWTDIGRDYRSGTLERMRGVRYKRNVLGIWAANEGTVYESFDPDIHETDKFPNGCPYDWPRYWVTDFGFKHPFVWQQWAKGPDGELVMEYEIYRSKTLLRDQAALIESTTAESPRPLAWICDHDAQDRFELEALLPILTKPAYKAVRPGIEATTARLEVQANGRPQMFFRKNARVHEPDPELLEQNHPLCTVDEFGYYSWPKTGPKDEPVKEYDHGMDCVRYMVAKADKLGEDNKPTRGVPSGVIRKLRRF